MLHCRPYLVRITQTVCASITIVRYCPMVGTCSQLSCVMHKHVSLILQVAGLNAHDLIEMASIKTSDYVTVGGLRC